MSNPAAQLPVDRLPKIAPDIPVGKGGSESGQAVRAGQPRCGLEDTFELWARLRQRGDASTFRRRG